jgi:apolipoprotein N-acyltransferase
VDAIDVPVLIGAVVEDQGDPTHIFNMGIVWQPTSTGAPGPSDHYVKQHPVPFGEWVPARGILAKVIGRFDRVPRDFAAGDRTGVMQVGPAVLGDLICFEVAYDELARAAVRGDGVTGDGRNVAPGEGARVLAVQTNNATYALTGQPEQQLAMSRLRAVEHGRAVLVAATSGISAIITPDGALTGSLPEFVPGYLVRRIPLRDTLTLADRLGAWPELVATLTALGLLGLAVVRTRRGRDVGSVCAPVTPDAATTD